MSPQIEVVLEQMSSGVRVESLIPLTQMMHVSMVKGSDKKRICIRRTQVVLALVVTTPAIENLEKISFLLNGKSWTARSQEQTTTSAQFLIEDDLEFHTIACSVDGKYLFVAEIEVIAYREWIGDGASFFSPKWGQYQVEMELKAYLGATPKAARNRSTLDAALRPLIRAKGKDKRDSVQALHNAALELTALCMRLRKCDLVPDYTGQTELEIDIEGTLEVLRRHPDWLVETPKGPIVISGKNFTTPQIVSGIQNDGNPDLAVVVRIINASLHILQGNSDCFGAFLLLSAARVAVQRFASLNSRQVKQSEIVSWMNGEPSNPTTMRLKMLLLWVIRLANDSHRRSLDYKGGLRGLSSSFRDADLFEWSGFAAICTALNADKKSLEHGKAEVEAGPHKLINVNRPGGEKIVKQLLPGWRDNSILPSGYKPDYIVHFERSIAIPVDAKFRIGSTLSYPCSSDSIKEIQAYLDEFGVAGAIILVPAVPSNVSIGGNTAKAICINGAIRGRERRIWVLEHAPGLSGFDSNMRAAIDNIAAMTNVELSQQ